MAGRRVERRETLAHALTALAAIYLAQILPAPEVSATPASLAWIFALLVAFEIASPRRAESQVIPPFTIVPLTVLYAVGRGLVSVFGAFCACLVASIAYHVFCGRRISILRHVGEASLPTVCTFVAASVGWAARQIFSGAPVEASVIAFALSYSGLHAMLGLFSKGRAIDMVSGWMLPGSRLAGYLLLAVSAGAAVPLSLVASKGVMWPLLLSIVPAGLAFGLALMLRRQERRELETISVLSRLLQRAHPYTHGHIHRVAEYGYRIALRMGLSPERAKLVRSAAILHDLGKVGVDEALLDRPGPLNESETMQVRKHSEIGAYVLAAAGPLSVVADWIRHHHERVDGNGYPSGLVGTEIPIESRIIAVVDAYDAMVGGEGPEEARPYRERLTHVEAMAELRACSGTQFDARVVEEFRQMMTMNGAA
ncbi:HD-GYP domain-containing protein [Fimbriimonadia bacterium ATM]|nr:HD-GYP domain-containing protein [Fimbriimonadia bacterium ATM]